MQNARTIPSTLGATNGKWSSPFWEIWQDERNRYYIFTAVIVLKALSYWLVFAWLHPTATLDDLLFFRRNDIEYFQLIEPLSRLDFSSFSTFEGHGSDLIVFPLFQIAPYAIGYFVIGTLGIVIADVVVSLLTFVLFTWLLIEFRATVGAAKLTVLCFMVLEITLTKHLMWNVGYGHELTSFWDLRFPKPFVAFPLLLWCILWTNITWRNRSALTPAWGIVGGITYGAIINTDVFRAFPMHLTIALIIPAIAWVELRRGNLRAVASFIGAFVATYAILIYPFVLQRLGELPGFADRIGFTPVDRYALPSLRVADIGLAIIPIGLFGGIIFFQMLSKRSLRPPPVTYLIGLCVLFAILSMPIMTFIQGRIAQPFHFVDALFNYSSLLTLGIVVWFGSTIGARPGFATKYFIPAFFIITISICAVYSLYVPFFDSKRRQVQVSNYRPLLELENYREDSIELRREIRTGSLASAKVIGTLDPHVTFYSIYSKKFVYVPDAGIDVVEENEQISRLLSLCAILRLPDADIRAMAIRFDVQLYWGTVLKYNVDRFRRGYPAHNYLPEQQAALGSETLDFNVVVPKFVVEQFVDQYRRIKADPNLQSRYRIDAIVLAKSSDLKRAQPDPVHWRPVFENSSFRAWVAK